MQYLFVGILTGIVSAISLGPAFFVITDTSLKRGFFSGAIVAMGISLADSIYVTLILLGFAVFFENPDYRTVFSFSGGIMLLIFGTGFWLRKHRQADSPSHAGNRLVNPMRSFLKGFIINALNPYVPVYWLAVVAFSTSQLALSGIEVILFFAATLITLLLLDITKSWFAGQLRSHIMQYTTIIFRVVGTLFLLFGLKLVLTSMNFWPVDVI